jgi:DNA repair protein RadC
LTTARWLSVEGPRDKLVMRGCAALSDAELLAVVLRTGAPGKTALELANTILLRFDGLAGLLAADSDQILAVAGVGHSKYAQLRAAVEMARRSAEQKIREADVLTSPEQTRLFLHHHLGSRDREVFCCLFLDSQHRLLRCEDLFFGTLDGAAVYPREVAVRALQYRAGAVILAHNHPSGLAQPSAADKRITERIRDALHLLDIRVLDHLIIGRGQAFSFAEHGLL